MYTTKVEQNINKLEQLPDKFPFILKKDNNEFIIVTKKQMEEFNDPNDIVYYTYLCDGSTHRTTKCDLLSTINNYSWQLVKSKIVIGEN